MLVDSGELVGSSDSDSDGELLCSEVPESKGLLELVDSKELMGLSDSDSDSSEKLTGGMVSRRGRPRNRGFAVTFWKGRQWQKMLSVTVMSGHSRQS